MIKRNERMTMIAALTVLLLLLTAWFSAAATLTVSSVDDDGAGSLRAALANANDGDTIVFNLSDSPATITLTSDILLVNRSISIEGPGPDNLTIDGGGNGNVFAVVDFDLETELLNPDLTVTISGLTIANGFTDASGGGIFNAGRLTLSNCVLKDNFSRQGGGAVYSIGPSLSITDCELSGNSTGNPGSGDEEEGVYWFGGGAVLVRPYEYFPFDATLTIERCLITNNSAAIGGGISIYLATDNQVEARISNSTLSGNGWGTHYYEGSINPGHGGGISVWAFEGGSAHVTVEGCTLSGNYIEYGEGGAIYNYAFGGTAYIHLKNSTLSGNGVSTGYGTGAIANLAYSSIDSNSKATMSVDNCTLSGNWSGDETYYRAGTVVYALIEENTTNLVESLVELKNTILDAGQSGMNLLVDTNVSENVNIISRGNNLSSDDGGGFLTMESDRFNTDPMLDTLADNGGPTQTHALLADSPAIDAGSQTAIDASDIVTDQRGVTRPQGENNDIGAFELEVSEFGYEWSGVLPPVNPDGTSVFKARSTIPVKFMLTGLSAGITDLQATLSYIKIGSGSPGAVNESVSTSAATTGNVFRYDPASDEYIFNWSTKGMTQGAYRLYIDLGDGVERFVDVGLK